MARSMGRTDGHIISRCQLGGSNAILAEKVSPFINGIASLTPVPLPVFLTDLLRSEAVLRVSVAAFLNLGPHR
jgi:hypothetical protein